MVFKRSTPIEQAIEPEAPSHVDGLTGLPDRWQVEVWISEHLARSQRTGDRFGFFLVSVANLTEINAGYGSAVGDEVLQAVAESLNRVVSQSGLVARYLGSEFAIIRPGLFAIEEMSRIARSTMDALPRQVSFESFVVPVRIAVAGIISNPDLSDWALVVDSEQALVEANPMDNATMFGSVFQDNPASARVLTHSGFDYLGDAEAFCVARDATVPTWTYSRNL